MNNELIVKLKEIKPYLFEKFGIEEFAVFGSTARGDETEESDVDIAIIKMKRINGLILADAQLFLSTYLNRNVDIGIFHSIRPYVRNKIIKDLLYV